MIFNLFNKKPKEDTINCVYCGRTIEEHETSNSLAYEAIGDSGNLEEFYFGEICTRCADVLDKKDQQDHYIESNNDD